MVRTRPGERERICEVIAGIHNAVFVDTITAEDIELTQLTSDENEMDAYGHRFGVNIKMWRRWGAVKKMEVVLHELAHLVEPEDGHRQSFWERFVDLVQIAEQHHDEIDAVMGEQIDFEKVKRKIVDEVHDGIIDQRMDTVAERKRWCREEFELRPREKQGHSTESR